MENPHGAESPVTAGGGTGRAGWGPRPAGTDAEVARVPLSRAQAAVLAAVAAGAPGAGETPQLRGPVSLAALTAATGLHENTLRGHLEALLRSGLVRRRRSSPSGRGRPAWLYEVAGGQAGGRLRAEYAGLAGALAASIHRTSPTPREDAVAAGVDWGRELARAAGRHGGSPAEDVLALLTELGFAPRPHDRPAGAAPRDVALTRCPLLDAARRYPDVVCGVHLGIVRGAFAEWGTDGDGTELVPFAEPEACLLRLPPAAAGATP